MRVLAIDASLRKTGVAVIEASAGKFQALYFGVIQQCERRFRCPPAWWRFGIGWRS